MKMQIFKKDGNVIDKVDVLGRTPHQQNMEYLNRNVSLKNEIRAEVTNFIKKFVQDIIAKKEANLNSADVAFSVSNILQLPHDNKYSLVGSMLFEEIEAYDCTVDGLDKNLTVVAIKGGEKHHFNYFFDKTTVARTR